MIGFPLIPILGSCERASNHSSLEKTAGSTAAFFLAVKRNGCGPSNPSPHAAKSALYESPPPTSTWVKHSDAFAPCDFGNSDPSKVSL